MQNKILIFVTLIILTFPLADIANAHLGEHESIQLLTEEINKDNQNAKLYLERGKQHRLAGHFDLAVIDFERARKLDTENSLVDLYIGQLFLDFGWNITSEYYLKSYLKYHSSDTTALMALGRSLFNQKKGREASQIYSRALEIIPSPSPEFYNEMADSYLIEGNYVEALKILDDGINNLGNNTFLEEKAMEIELNNGMFDKSLSRIDKLIEYSPRKEQWLYKKGLILESLRSYEEAEEAYSSALNYLESRPRNKRKIGALLELEREIKKSLDRLSQK